jgi:hypothetical protein
MGKSKKQTEFEQINDLASYYKKLTDEQLIAIINNASIHSQKKYRAAVKNELKRRGISVN